MSIIWRPHLFSALGAAFKSDATLADGLHLRWMIDPRLGIPFRFKDRSRGQFQVYEQTSKFPSLATAGLNDVKAATSIPVHSVADADNNYRLENIQDRYYFVRKATEPANLAAEELLNQLRMLHQWRITRSQRPFISYIKGLAKIIKGEALRTQPFFQRSEVVAVDIQFITGVGTVPGGDSSTNSGCLGIFSAFAEKRYLSVRAFDKEGQLLMEDWVGLYSFKAEYLSNPSARNKFSVRLRAPGIHHVQIIPVAGQQNMKTDNFQWIFCEEYCNASVWKSIDQPVRFEVNPDAYNETILEDKYYEPFRKTLDWAETLTTLVSEVLQTNEVHQAFSANDTFDMFTSAITMDDNDPSPGGENSLASIPALPVLIHAAMDPAVASLLALYQHKKEQDSPRDIRIVAKAPFFTEENLELLYERLKSICAENGVPFNLQTHLGWFNVIRKLWVDLGALVLAPFVGVKPAPPTPSAFTTTVTSVDLPLEEPGHSSLLVDSILRIPKPPFSLLPYLTVQAFEIERSIDNFPLVNPATDKISTRLDKLGILPPVYIPTIRVGETNFIVRDNFSLPVPPAETVRYRARAYDLFARPSAWTDGATENIPVPCYPPETPGILSANPFVQNNQLWVELFITVSGLKKDFQAIANYLEITIHAINEDETGAMSSIRWIGERMARGLTMAFNAGNFPDPLTQQQSCLNLNGTGIGNPISWNAAIAGSCDTTFPLQTAVIEIIDDPLGNTTATDFQTYHIKMAVASLTLPPGDYRWCTRARVKGTCAQGDTIFSIESCSGFSYHMVTPPAEPIQPLSSIIPESTFPDKTGNSFYNIPLNGLVPPVTATDDFRLNFYLISLEKLQEDISTLVDGKILLAGAQPTLLQLARANRSRYKKLNIEPVKILSTPVHYPVPVDGNVETYHIVGIVGANAELQETPWERATILIFKTPKPVPKPKLRFTAINSQLIAEKLIAKMSFRASFDVELTSAVRIPRVQLVRHDLSTGKSRFVGEVAGAWGSAGNFYQFSFEDRKLLSWRHYSYEAVLLCSSEGKWVKSDVRANGDTLAPGLNTEEPLNETFPKSFTVNATGITIQFEFLIGDFDFSLTKTNADGTQQRFNGRIKNKEVMGLTGAGLIIVALEKNYRMTWTDTASTGTFYTLRLFRGQGMPWTNKLKIS